MATRVLPGAYVTLNDLSQFPEGPSSLTVGYVLKCNRGDVNQAMLVTSPSDFLTKTTLTGTPALNDDTTFWSILKVLARTNQVYIVRAAKDPLYGGAVIQKASTVGSVTGAVANTKTLTVTGEIAPAADAKITVKGTGVIDGNYTVASASVSSGVITIVVKEALAADYTAGTTPGTVVGTPITPLSASIATPEAYTFQANDVMLITGINPGAYNGELSFDIVSAEDNAGSLVYPNTMQLTVRLAATKEVLETFVFSRDPLAKAIDGTSLYFENVVNQVSAYIRVRDNSAVASDVLPNSTLPNAPIQAGAGSNGAEVDENTLVGALNVFADKTIPISILGNGCSAEAESATFQQAMLELADTRKDIVAFLNSRKVDEAASLNSVKAQNVVDYKKGTLASTSFYGCMYAPHVNTPDTFNSRQVAIGSDAVAIAGWLNVINNLNYPYAYAGPQNGLVTGVTCDWKIGDESGEAELLNDASINYVAFDGKVGRYYMQCQNTLQVANSAFRNIGCVLNVLDIKETLGVYLKEYSNLPITDTLRRDIMNKITSYLSPMEGTRFYQYSFQDVTTDADIAQDTLRYLLTLAVTRYSAIIYAAINVVGPNYDFSMLQSA